MVESGGSTATTEAGGTDAFTVRLARQLRSGTVYVRVTVGDSTECEVWNQLQTQYGSTTILRLLDLSDVRRVTVRGKDDDLDDGVQNCAITLDPSNPGDRGYNELPDVTVLASNWDDDGPGLMLSKTVVATGEDGTADTFTVRLATAPTAMVTVAVSSSDAGEAAASPSSLKFGATADSGNSVFAWNDPQTVRVRGENDAEMDGSQPYVITLATTSTDADYSGPERNGVGERTRRTTTRAWCCRRPRWRPAKTGWRRVHGALGEPAIGDGDGGHQQQRRGRGDGELGEPDFHTIAHGAESRR